MFALAINCLFVWRLCLGTLFARECFVVVRLCLGTLFVPHCVVAYKNHASWACPSSTSLTLSIMSSDTAVSPTRSSSSPSIKAIQDMISRLSNALRLLRQVFQFLLVAAPSTLINFVGAFRDHVVGSKAIFCISILLIFL